MCAINVIPSLVIPVVTIYAHARLRMPLLMGFVEPMPRQCVAQRCEEPCEERDDAWPAAAVCGCFLLLVLLGWTLYFWP